MPILPIDNSSQNINTAPAGVERNISAQPYEAMQHLTDTVSNITQKLSDANDVMQVTKAQTDHGMALAQAKLDALRDPNPDNAETHIRAVNLLTENATDGIQNQQVAKDLAPKLQQESFLANIQIQDDFFKKRLLSNDISLGNAADLAAQNKSNAVSIAAGQQVEHDFISLVNKNYVSGAINEGRAMSLIDNYQMGVVKNDIVKEGSTEIGDSKVLQEVNKGVDGAYPQLSTDQRIEADRMVRLQVMDNKKIQIQQSLSTRVDTIKSIANGDLTWQNTNQISQIAAKDPKLGEALQAVFNANSKGTQYAPQSDQDQNFSELVNKLFSTKTKEEVNNYLVTTLNSAAEKNMSRDRLAILVSAAEQRGATLDTNKESGDGQIDSKQESVNNSVKHIQNFVKDNPKSNNVFVDFFKNLASGLSPAPAKDEAIRSNNLRNYPWLGTVPDNGLPGYDKITHAKVRVFKDGHIEADK